MTQRTDKIDALLRQEIGQALEREVSDPRIGFVTVVSVDTSPDLRSAKVYVSVLGDETEREQTLEGLGHCHGYLQSLLGAQLGMKRTPQLTFIFDETIERGMRIEKLLKEIEEQ